MHKPKLQHVVLIQYKDSVTAEEFKTIADGAHSLKQIEGVRNLQYTTNVSPEGLTKGYTCLLYTSPSPRDRQKSRMPSSA